MKMKSFSLLLISLFVFLMACKPSIENETKKFENNKQTVASFAAKYAAFKPLLDEATKKAQGLWDEALKINKEEDKAKKMAEANEALSGNPVYSGLNSYEGHVDRVKKLQNDLQPYTSKFQYRSIASSAISGGTAALAEAANIISTAKPTAVDNAAEFIKKANSILIDAEGKMERAKKQIKGSSSSKKKK